MAKITSNATFDTDVINDILQTANLGTKKKEDLSTSLASISIEVPDVGSDRQVRFSDAFWSPEIIPDLPLTVFRDTDWGEVARVRIPEANPHWVWPKEATELLALAMYCKDTTLIWGLQGTGKSDLPQQWCSKFNIPFWRMGCHRETREVHFIGNVSVSYDENGAIKLAQEPTILTDSLRYGGVYVEDEAFRHSSALVLQPLREKNTRTLFLPDAPGSTGTDRVLKAPDNWWYILTDNTCGLGDETGVFDAEVQDASTLDRIGATIELGYLEKEHEEELLAKAHGTLPRPVIENMVAFANIIRADFRNQAVMTTFSIRSLLAWAEKIMLLGDAAKSLKITWWGKLNNDDRSKASDAYHQVFGERL